LFCARKCAWWRETIWKGRGFRRPSRPVKPRGLR
jgi:hypothetical protein